MHPRNKLIWLRLLAAAAFARLCRAVRLLVGVQDGDAYWESEEAHRLISLATTAAERIDAVETCVLRGVPLDYCFTLCRIAPLLANEHERTKFVAWLDVVREQVRAPINVCQ